MRDCKLFSKLIASLIVVLFASLGAWGQASYTAQVRGVVTDKSGAVVQNATVTITNQGTNQSGCNRISRAGRTHPAGSQ